MLTEIRCPNCNDNNPDDSICESCLGSGVLGGSLCKQCLGRGTIMYFYKCDQCGQEFEW